jgi:hypothetical protein
VWRDLILGLRLRGGRWRRARVYIGGRTDGGGEEVGRDTETDGRLRKPAGSLGLQLQALRCRWDIFSEYPTRMLVGHNDTNQREVYVF